MTTRSLSGTYTHNRRLRRIFLILAGRLSRAARNVHDLGVTSGRVGGGGGEGDVTADRVIHERNEGKRRNDRLAHSPLRQNAAS